jgi:hypothetical protein
LALAGPCLVGQRCQTEGILVPDTDRQSVTRRVLVFFTLIVFISTIISPLAAFASDPVASPDPSASASENPSPEPTQEPVPSEVAPDATPESIPGTEPSSDPTPLPTPVAPDYAPSGPPNVASDKDDYAPGELVILSGSNWEAGEAVHIRVNDDFGSSWNRDVDVVASDSGEIADQFNLPNWFVANYSVVATGTASGVARTAFTDSQPQSVTVDAPTNVTVSPGGTANYGSVHANLNGNNNDCTVTLAAVGLPAGAVAAFDNSPVTGHTNFTSSLSVSTTAAVSPNTYSFNVTATPGAGCQNGAQTQTSSNLTLVVVKRIASVGVGAQTGTLTSGTAGSATYAVTVSRNGSTGASFSAALSVTTSLPAGVTTSFSPSTVNFSASDTSKTSVLTISTTAASPSGATSFTVLAQNTVVSGDSATGNGSLAIASSCVAPTVTTNPGSQSITYGANASFLAAASGSPTPTILWQVDSGSGFGSTGVTTGTLTLTKPPVAATGNQYRAVFTNSCGSATSNAASLTVSPKNLTVTGAAADSRPYDGSASATVSFVSASLNGVESGDTVTINSSGYSAAFADKNVGSGKPVTVLGVALAGVSAPNYAVSQPSGLTAEITARALTITATGVNKTYDGTTDATVTLADDRISGDIFNASYAVAAFDDENVGTAKQVSVSGINISGTDAGNYTFNTTASTTANIARFDVTGSFTAADKTYDGTTAADVLTTTVNGALGGDDVDLAYDDATFDTAAAGEDKTVTLNNVTLTGAAAGNYHLTSVSTTTADISKADPTCVVTGYSGTYDGDAHGASGSCTGVDDETLTGLALGASFTNVPGGTASWTFTDETGNYNNDAGTAAIEISQRQISVTADAKTKIFGNPDPAFTWHLTSGSLVAGDSITGSLTRTSNPPASELVGTHPILQGTVTAGSNYLLTYVGANLTITSWTAAGSGFYPPVGTLNSVFVPAPGLPATPSCGGSIWNSAKGGSTVPLKFNVFAGNIEKTSLTDIIGFTASTVSCSGTPTYTDTLDFTTTGNTSLRYDGTGGQWIQNWKTPNVAQNTYYRVYVKFADGSTLSAFFLLKK